MSRFGRHIALLLLLVASLASASLSLAQEPDSDGDGIIDARDQCPTIPGQGDVSGCPQSDIDNDGVKDYEDVCVDIPGIGDYQGCPNPDTPTAEPTPGAAPEPTTQPAQTRNALLPPLEGPCQAATYFNSRVNARRAPDAQSEIVGTLDPSMLYDVLGVVIPPGGDATPWLAVVLPGANPVTLTTPLAFDPAFRGGVFVSAGTVLMGGDCLEPVALLLPAVQKVREAAARRSVSEAPQVRLIDDPETGLPALEIVLPTDPSDPLSAGFARIDDIKGESGDNAAPALDDFTVGNPTRPQPIIVGILYKIGKFLVTCCPADGDQVDPGAGDDCVDCDQGGTGGDTDGGDGQAFCESKFLEDLAAAGAQTEVEIPGDGSVKIWLTLPDGTELPSYDCDEGGPAPQTREHVLLARMPQSQGSDTSIGLLLPAVNSYRTSVQYPYWVMGISPAGMTFGRVGAAADGTMCVDLQSDPAAGICSPQSPAAQ